MLRPYSVVRTPTTRPVKPVMAPADRSNSPPIISRATATAMMPIVEAPLRDGAIAIEPTADNKFQLFHGIVTFEFDAAKGQMILKRGPLPMIFTKEK